LSYNLLPQALDDLDNITTTIAADNPRAAGQWLSKIENTFETLGAMPLMGTPRFDVRPDMRTFAFGNYLILHRVRGDGVDIVRVVHGAREWEGLV
jgi:toxin ParE1/3/4